MAIFQISYQIWIYFNCNDKKGMDSVLRLIRLE